MGQAASRDVARAITSLLSEQSDVRMVFAAAPSQSEMLEALAAAPGIDWGRVTAFHMDEYVGLPDDSPQRFASWLRHALFDRCPFGRVHTIDPSDDLDECVRGYAELLDQAPIDIVCLGIGTNGHLAFNDPHVSDLGDPRDVAVVPLDEINRLQQVEDGCFEKIEDVPQTAITLTIPMLLSAKRMFCVVPGAAKRQAVWRTFHDPVSASCPSTVLRMHRSCRMYLDLDSDPERGVAPRG